METDHDIEYNDVRGLASDSYKFRLQIKETLKIQEYFAQTQAPLNLSSGYPALVFLSPSGAPPPLHAGPLPRAGRGRGTRSPSGAPPPLHAGPLLPRGPLPCAGLLHLGVPNASADCFPFSALHVLFVTNHIGSHNHIDSLIASFVLMFYLIKLQ